MRIPRIAVSIVILVIIGFAFVGYKPTPVEAASTWYIDYVNGNDSNGGTSWGDSWKTLTYGATAARIGPGDSIRIAKSDDPNLVESAIWTNDDKTVLFTGTGVDEKETDQTTGESSIGLSGPGATIAGHEFDNWPVSEITSVAVYLGLDGAPSGTVSVTIRDASGSLLGTLGTKSASTIEGDYYIFDSSSVSISSVSTIRICVEFSGGDESNWVTVGYSDSNVVSGSLVYYDGSWHEDSGSDLRWQNLTYEVSGFIPGTEDVEMCETAWTGVGTSPSTTSSCKQGSKAVVIAAPTSTNYVRAYVNFSLPLGLGSYDSLTLWIKTSAAISDSNSWAIRLSSTFNGSTGTHVFKIPASTGVAKWTPLTLTRDGGGYIETTVNSIAICSGSTIPTGTITIDDILVCDSSCGIGVNSLISKNSLAKGGSEGWHGIQSINGLNVELDNYSQTVTTKGNGYWGSTENISTYKRDPISLYTNGYFSVKDSGTSSSPITITGGYNTSSSIVDGDTIIDGLDCNTDSGLTISNKDYIHVSGVSAVRFYHGIDINYSDYSEVQVQDVNNCAYGVFAVHCTYLDLDVENAIQCGGDGVRIETTSGESYLDIENANSNGVDIGVDQDGSGLQMENCFNITAEVSSACNNMGYWYGVSIWEDYPQVPSQGNILTVSEASYNYYGGVLVDGWSCYNTVIIGDMDNNGWSATAALTMGGEASQHNNITIGSISNSARGVYCPYGPWPPTAEDAILYNTITVDNISNCTYAAVVPGDWNTIEVDSITDCEVGVYFQGNQSVVTINSMTDGLDGILCSANADNNTVYVHSMESYTVGAQIFSGATGNEGSIECYDNLSYEVVDGGTSNEIWFLDTPEGLTLMPGSGSEVFSSWVLEDPPRYVLLRYSLTSYPTTVSSGTLVYEGNLSGYSISGLVPGSTCYFSIWESDGSGHYSCDYTTGLITTSYGPSGVSEEGDTSSSDPADASSQTNNPIYPWISNFASSQGMSITDTFVMFGLLLSSLIGSVVLSKTASSFWAIMVVFITLVVLLAMGVMVWWIVALYLLISFPLIFIVETD